MKTQINKICLIFLASVTLLFGCSKDFLDNQQVGAIQSANFYKTDADATGAILSCYNMLMTLNASVWTSEWMAKMSLCDEIITGGENSADRPEYQQLTKFTFGSDNVIVTNIYRYSYMLIYRANLIIDNFGKLPKLTAYQSEVIAEAKTLRAYMYFELVTLYGTPPLVLHELIPSTYAQPNSTQVDLWKQIESDLHDGINGLPVKSAQAAAGSDIARVSKGFAQALLGKSLLFEKNYSGAAQVLQDLINSKEYSLYTLADLGYPKDTLAYTQLFRKSTEFGKESVFEISFNNNRNNDWSNKFGDLWNDPSRTNPSNMVWQLCGPRGDHGFAGGSFNINGGWGFGYPTESIYQAYKDLGDSVRMHANCITYHQLLNAGGTLVQASQSISGKDTILTDTNFPWGCPGYIRVKYTTWADETTGQAELNYGTNLRVIRYSDVLLMAAEANFMANQNPTRVDSCFNAVRTRVLLNPVAGVTLNDIKLERRLELSFEGDRYQDLVRWGDAPTVLATLGQHVPTGVLSGTLLPGVKITNSKNQTTTYVHWDLTKPLTMGYQDNSGAGFKARNVLFPIPLNEINSNPNMKQNPGY